MSSRDAAELRSAVIRLALQFTALIVVLLAVMGALLYSIVAASTAESTTRSLMAATSVDSPHDAPLGTFVAMYANGEVRTPPSVPVGLPDMSAINRVAASHVDERESFSAGGRSYAVLTAFRGERVVQAAVDTHEGRESLDRLLWAVAVSIAAAAGLAAGVSVWMAGRAMRPLAESLALQRRFVADASHELRTPLTLLSTRAQLLRRKLDAAAAKTPRQSISAEVGRIVEDSRLLTGILDDLLIAADPRSAADHTEVDLRNVARDAVALALPDALQRSIQLEHHGPAGPVMVQGSPVALLRVFTALISNALDHARGHVSVTVSATGKDASIVVSDDGPGFPPGTESRVFERFSSSRQPPGGTGAPRHYGLGLALVAEIVGLHQGKVTVENAPDGGAAVRVLMPLAQL